MRIILLLLACVFTFTNQINPELLKFNQKVYAELLVDNSDALTDDDIRISKVEYTDGSVEESLQWPNGEIPYSLDIPKFNEEFLKEFYAALNEFHSKTCIKFRPKQKNDSFFVKIIRGDGCWSYVGMQPDLIQQGQELSLGDECWKKGIIIHELNHVIGFFHEHSRFDRDSYVYLNFSNIQKNRIRQFDQRPKQKVDEIGVYDLYSIMHYEQNAFAIDKRSPTIIPKIKHAKINEMGQRKHLSPADVAKILVLYNCSSKLTKPSSEVFKSYKNIEMPFHDGNGIFDNFPLKMSAKISKTNMFQKSVPFKDFDDFKIRTGRKEIPEGYSFEFLTSEKTNSGAFGDDWRFKMYPNQDSEFVLKMDGLQKMKCNYFAASNCADQYKECPKYAVDGLCEKKPGMMLIMCRRSCCNCDSTKCFDTDDKQKFNTLCAARNHNSVANACLNSATRQNALDYCPKTCGVRVVNPEKLSKQLDQNSESSMTYAKLNGLSHYQSHLSLFSKQITEVKSVDAGVPKLLIEAGFALFLMTFLIERHYWLWLTISLIVFRCFHSNLGRRYLKTLPRDLKGLYTLLRIKFIIKLAMRRNFPLHHYFLEHMKANPNAECVVDIETGKTFTFTEFNKLANKYANFYRNRGYKKDDVVALFVENSPEFFAIWFGLSKLGVITAWINTKLKMESLGYSIKISKAKTVITSSCLSLHLKTAMDKGHLEASLKTYLIDGNNNGHDNLAELINDESEPPFIPDLHFQSVLCYIYKSGNSKPTVIKHSRYYWISIGCSLAFGFGSKDRVYVTMPMCHSAAGVVGVGQVIASGATIVIRKKFSASNFWKDCVKYRCTASQYIGEIARYLLAQKPCPEERLHNVWIMFGNGFRGEIWPEFVQRFGIKVIGEFYGSTEGNSNIANLDNHVGACGFFPIYPFLTMLYSVKLLKIDPETGVIVRDENGLCISCRPGDMCVMVGAIKENDPLSRFEGYAEKGGTQKKIIRDVCKKGDAVFSFGDVLYWDKLGYLYFNKKVTSFNYSKMLRERNERLKCIYEDEGLTYGPDVDETGLSNRFNIALELRNKRIDQVFRDICLAKIVDLCFLVDVTGSMSSHIDSVKKSIHAIVENLTSKTKHVSFAVKSQTAERIKMAFVAYRDFKDCKQFEILNFTESITEFQIFCNNLKAEGGDDTPEDIFGGIEKMLDLEWDSENSTKVCFHIADAPCHGRRFYTNSLDDDYPEDDPNGRTHTDLFSRIRSKNIQYHFGKITDLTEKMVDEFSKVYGEPIVSSDITEIDNICDSIVTAVKSSVAVTITKTISATGRTRCLRSFTIIESEPDWSTIPKVEGLYVSYEMPKSITDIITDVPLQQLPPQMVIVQIATSPFSQGAERIAFYGKDVTNGSENIVLKQYKHAGMLSVRRYETTNQIQTVAAYLAKLFVDRLKTVINTKIEISFLKVRTLSINDSTTQQIMSCERRYLEDDKFLRFTNNTDYGMVESTAAKYGVDLEFIQALMAFSHWTYQASNKCLMVVDLQGVISRKCSGEKVLLLTDPAIHCDDPTRFGSMNLGVKGMKNFFIRHVCNDFCQALGLVPVHFTEVF